MTYEFDGFDAEIIQKGQGRKDEIRFGIKGHFTYDTLAEASAKIKSLRHLHGIKYPDVPMDEWEKLNSIHQINRVLTTPVENGL